MCKCNTLLSGKFPLLSFVLLMGCLCLLEGIKNLGIWDSPFEASSVCGLGKDDGKGGLGEQRRFSGEH